MRRGMAVSVFLVAAMVAAVMASVPATAGPTNVDVSQRHLNESEEAIAVNPTNPNNIVVFTNVFRREAGLTAGMFLGVSFDGGQTWKTSLVGDNDNLGDACCDPTLSFDLFANIGAGGSATASRTGTDDRGLFRFVDQPTIISGENSAWVVFNAGGPMVATGAPVTGLGQVGSFSPVEVVPGSNNCTYGDVAIGPSGQVMNVCTLTETGQGGGKLLVSVDPDRLGPAPFGKRVSVTDTHIGGFDFIPPQPDRSVDAEPGLAWDRTGGPHKGRVYLVYTLEVKNESDNTDIEVRYSDDGGATWSGGVRVNDDRTVNSQFLPKISLDPTTGQLAVVWYDARNDLGTGGSGDTDGVPNDDAQFWGAFSPDGRTFTPNVRISAG